MTSDGLPHQVLEFFRSYGNVGTEPSQLLGYGHCLQLIQPRGDGRSVTLPDRQVRECAIVFAPVGEHRIVV
jgi:hypothetical protein